MHSWFARTVVQVLVTTVLGLCVAIFGFLILAGIGSIVYKVKFAGGEDKVRMLAGSNSHRRSYDCTGPHAKAGSSNM